MEFGSLPDDCIFKILNYLDDKSKVRCCSVSRRMHSYIKHLDFLNLYCFEIISRSPFNFRQFRSLLIIDEITFNYCELCKDSHKKHYINLNLIFVQNLDHLELINRPFPSALNLLSRFESIKKLTLHLNADTIKLDLKNIHLNHLELSGTEPIEIYYPDSLKKLTFLCSWHQSVDDLPSGLQYLEFASYFNQPVDNLPPGLQILKFTSGFDHPIDNLPPGLKHLEFKYTFNHRSIDNLPPGLKHLELSNIFNMSVDNLPDGLIFLKLGRSFNQPIELLPLSLEHLELGRNFDQRIDHLPPNLKYLHIDGIFYQSVDNLPENLTTLILNGGFNQPINNLPSSLKSLTVSDYFDQPIDNLPAGLKHLTLGMSFDHDYTKYLDSLETLTLHRNTLFYYDTLRLYILKSRFKCRITIINQFDHDLLIEYWNAFMKGIIFGSITTINIYTVYKLIQNIMK